ncbi:SpoIIAA-like [Modicisalibacter ilicicola DSM 19980]|uniref:SpoIIAA-like n=1 Tax=Modicisalibacter ilicicola DSM 19980 TaxID=1121942 RepID=A0A1M4YGZ1_9GAMM|nr:STAS/SEC14 domain-containing protein [Halomonas ilicicola]SHF05035.1 SpoIIAA-like [Halomonas ilicicola DSM 19980]
MLELIAAPASHVVAMRISGCVDADELQRGIDAIEQAKQVHPKISFFIEIDHLRWMTGTALVRDIGYGLTQFGRLHHFHRAAVVTDQQWIRTIATIENHLFNPIEVRPFTSREKEAAMKWVCELPVSPETENAPSPTP